VKYLGFYTYQAEIMVVKKAGERRRGHREKISHQVIGSLGHYVALGLDE
jgi:hypothetical protein